MMVEHASGGLGGYFDIGHARFKEATLGETSARRQQNIGFAGDAISVFFRIHEPRLFPELPAHCPPQR